MIKVQVCLTRVVIKASTNTLIHCIAKKQQQKTTQLLRDIISEKTHFREKPGLFLGDMQNTIHNRGRTQLTQDVI